MSSTATLRRTDNILRQTHIVQQQQQGSRDTLKTQAAFNLATGFFFLPQPKVPLILMASRCFDSYCCAVGFTVSSPSQKDNLTHLARQNHDEYNR